MENGVETIERPLSEEETRTADGGISQLKLADNVVQVFPAQKVPEEEREGDVESVDRPLSELETRTADGGISQLKLADNVVQVFPKQKVSEEEGEWDGGSVDRPLSEEEKRTADGGVSQLKLVDNVVPVVHERNVSEGDEVFEEAMDGNPEDVHAQEHSEKPGLDEAIVDGDDGSVEKKNGDLNLLEVNGSPNGGHTIEKFEEAIDADSPTADSSSEVETPIVAEKNMDSLAAAEPVEQVRVSEGVVDGHDDVKDVHPEESKDDVEEIVEEVVKEVSPVIDSKEKLPMNDVKEVSAVEDDEDKMPLKDVKEDVNGSCDDIVHEKAENGDLDEVKLREIPAVHTSSSDVNHVSLDETGLSHGNESSEQIVHEDDRSWELKGTTDCVDTSFIEERETPETKDVTTNLSDSVTFVNAETAAQETIPTETDGGVDTEAEADTKDGQKSGTQPGGQNNEEGSDSRDVLENVEGHEAQSEQDKQGSVIDDLVVSSMANGTETEPVVKNAEKHETQNEQESQDSEIKELGESRVDEETKTAPVVKNPEEHGTQTEQEKKDLEIEELGESTMAEEAKTQTVVDTEEREIEDEQEIKELGESGVVEERIPQPVVKDPEVLEAQIEKEKQGPEIKGLGVSSMVKERKTQPAVEPSPPSRPAGLGSAAPLLEPTRAPQQSRVNGATPQRQTQLVEDAVNGEAEENDETREKLQMIRVKFLRLAHRLGQTPHNVVVAQVLYRLGLAEQLRGRNQGRVGAFSFDRASAMAEQLEAAGQEPLDFSCTIMVLGKTGVGKSATINSIFDEVKFGTDAFEMGTKKVQDVVGTVQGIKVRVIDTPGLLPCWSDQRQNEKILHSVKRFIKKNPPDIVLYLDRLDMQSRDLGDMPLLRTITEIFGPSIWFNAIVVLTHAASAPPDGPNGTASSYEMFVTQRSHVVQQAIRQAAGDMRLMNPVSLVENHSACRTNRAGQRVLPNGQVWKPHLLLLSFASKILAEANTLLKLQDSPPGKPFATRSRAPPLPYLLSSLLQSRAQVKLPEEQYGDEDGLDEDLDETSDSDDESDYDELPPFKSLTKAQLAKLSKAQKKAYFDELEYREKLFMKKQLKEEKRRRKLLKKMEASAKDLPSDYSESAEEESGGAASVPVPMPDFALPVSFDSDNPTHRYRFLDSSNQWLVRPVLETHGWDHDVGYEGINVEKLFVVKEKIPLSFSGQVTKDKKESNLQMELASSIKHGEGKATSLGFDMQTIGKDMAYTLRSDTRFSNFRHNKTAAGLSVTLLGDALTAGVKLEDKLIVNKRFRVVMTGGAMTGRGDVAYGGSLEATLRDKDYPLGRTLSTLGLSIMDWHGDLAIGCNVQSQIPIGRSTNLVARANLNNRGSGQVSIRLNSSEQLQIALIGLVPLLRKIYGQYQQMLQGE